MAALWIFKSEIWGICFETTKRREDAFCYSDLFSKKIITETLEQKDWTSETSSASCPGILFLTSPSLMPGTPTMNLLRQYARLIANGARDPNDAGVGGHAKCENLNLFDHMLFHARIVASDSGKQGIQNKQK